MTRPVSNNFDGVEMDAARQLVLTLNARVVEIGSLLMEVRRRYVESRWTGPDADQFQHKLDGFDQLMRRRTREMLDAANHLRAIQRAQEKKSQ